ncbi:MAG: polysaccharide pyruvyl transferase family protein [Lactobacillus sp.]|nr:polysaccharide pyruvyl transferase family protein [Lactobacillus sp.]
MKKKNAILTFQGAPNYGAFLQAYALQTAASQFDPAIEIIDYRAKFTKKHYDPYRIKNGYFKSLLRIILYSSKERKRNNVFESYRLKYLNLTPEKVCTQVDLQNLCMNFTNIICGSDQIWNMTVTDGDLSYFLPFPLMETTKNSYAASMGNQEVEKVDEIKNYLLDFENIGVREKDAAERLQKVLPIPVTATIDPTLLLSKQQWDDFAKEKVATNESYILVYTVKQPKNLIKEAVKLGKKKGLKVIQITERKKKNGIVSVQNQSPCQFVSYFREASYVFTNSFHGSVFSLIYQKQFAIELDSLDGSRNNRTESLYKDLGIQLNFREELKDIDRQIDWKNIKEKLDKRREQSRLFLLEILA